MSICKTDTNFSEGELGLVYAVAYSQINSTVLSVYCKKMTEHSNNAVTTEKISISIYDKNGQWPNVLICKMAAFPPEPASVS